MIETVGFGVVIIALVATTLLVRQRSTGRLPGVEFWSACVVGIAAVAAGTTLPVSGVLLAVPVVAAALVAVIRGGWWLGDGGLFLTVLGIGTAAAYIMAAVLDPNTGSFADQGALALIVLGCVAAVALSLVRGRKRAGRRQRAEPTSTRHY